MTDCGRRCLQLPGDIADPAHCRDIVKRVVDEFGRIDILVNNAAHQDTFDSLEEIPDEEWQRTFAVNIHAMFYLAKAAVPHMQPGASIINTASINADSPSPSLLAYATTKGAIQNYTGGLAQLLAEKGIRVNCVAPGPVWTPLIPASMSAEKTSQFGANYPMKRPAQPVELASAYVMLAEPMSSYVSGATIAGDRRQAADLGREAPSKTSARAHPAKCRSAGLFSTWRTDSRSNKPEQSIDPPVVA